jgi:SAM-dependent methyltransferase
MKNLNLIKKPDSPTGFHYTGGEVLDIMHQYARRRNQGVEQLIRRHLAWQGQAEYQLLEFGAGKGEFIDRFAGEPGLRSQVVELDDDFRRELAKRHQAHRLIEEVPDRSIDGLYLIDVLEHLEDDRGFLRQFYQKLKPGGRLFVYVPARPELFSAFDSSIGHYRRYLKQELKEKVLQAGFSLKVLHYHELLGYFAASYNAFFAQSGKLNPRMVAIYDRWLVPTDRLLARAFVPPIGKSLYLLAEKPPESE